MRVAVVTFPGSNCDRDVSVAVTKITGKKPLSIWHQDHEIPNCDLIIIPGGFSYGDYLRCGSMASKSRIMQSVINFAKSGGLVMGICNGFQILTEANLLPGTLIMNNSLKFICKEVQLKTINKTSLLGLVFIYPEELKSNNKISIDFSFKFAEVKYDMQKFMKLLTSYLDILDNENPPDHDEDCETCNLFVSAARMANEK